MGIRLAALGLCAALALTHPPALRAQEVAWMLGDSIDRSELPTATEGPASELGTLYDRVWNAVSRHYIEQNQLAATPEEVGEVLGYEREFERRDRIQRARKLAELEQRLADQTLTEAERVHLEEFRAVLARLARNDADNDRVPPDPEQGAMQRARWVEMWKLNRALYEQYGGVVALTRFGPFPHGARVAVIEDYERRGLLGFADGDLRARLLALLSARPPMTIAPELVDFTPDWKRPIPPSYFPD